LKIEVTDDVHVQSQRPQDLWKQDSLQLGFDVDFGSPWLSNSLKYNKSHRVMEYGVAFGEDGNPMVWRFSSDSDLPADSPEPEVKASIERRDGISSYVLVFPWQTLSLKASPEPGSDIGIAVAVNDFDTPAVGRHGLRLFNGIVDVKDPASFGALHLSKNEEARK
jgi:hypothetical protein